MNYFRSKPVKFPVLFDVKHNGQKYVVCTSRQLKKGHKSVRVYYIRKV